MAPQRRRWGLQRLALAFGIVFLLSMPVLPVNLISSHAGVPSRLTGGAAHDGRSVRSTTPCPIWSGCSPIRAGAPPAPLANGSNNSSVLPAGWTDITSTLTTYPSLRTQPAIAYDPKLAAVILFGGYNPAVVADRDTWEFKSNTWTDLTATVTTPPPARWGASMAWDAADGYLLLFGGRSTATFLNDTWTFNGTGWTQVNTTSAPAPRSQFSMVYDAPDAYVVIEGGLYENVSASSGFIGRNDTWSYLKGNWTNQTLAGALPSFQRAGGVGAYDPWNSSAVAVGGTSTNPANGCSPTSPVATYSSGHWWAYGSGVGPQNLSETMMAYDPQGPFLLVFGGYSSSGVAAGNSTTCVQVNNTWIRFDGTWVNLTSSIGPAPSIRYLSGMAYDAADKEVVLFGGNSHGAYLSDTWTFVAPTMAVNLTTSRLGGAIPLTLRFTAAPSLAYGPVSYIWSFGDGQSATTGPNVTHVFLTTGRFHVVVNVTDTYGRNASSGFNITAVLPPVASAQPSPAVGSVPLVVAFHGTVSGGQTPFAYAWQFGDGASGTGAFVNHTYLWPGNFTANLTATDVFGDRNRTTTFVQVAPRLFASALGSPPDGIVPLPVNFTAPISGGNPPYTYLWDFGDGGQATTAAPNHVYTTVANYTARVTVTDLYHRSVNASAAVSVFAPLAGGVTLSVTRGIAPLQVTMGASASGGLAPYSYSWQFGDQSATGTGSVNSYIYARPGNFTVNLTVVDSEHRTTVAHAVVSVYGPLRATVSGSPPVGEVPENVTFAIGSSGGIPPLTERWTFGDGNTQSGLGPVSHIFVRAGSYPVSVDVTDAIGERVRATTLVVLVNAVIVSVTVVGGSLRLGSEGNLSAQVQWGKGPFTYTWSGLPPGCASQNLSTLACSPTASGSYVVVVTVVDGYGRTAAANTTVTVPALPLPPASVSTSWALYLGVAGVAIAAAAGLILWRRGRRPPAEPASDQPTAETLEPEDPPG